MNLQIRDPLAHELAMRLAKKRKVTMTDAVIDALRAELRRQSEDTPLAERLAEIADDLRSKAKAGGHDMVKEEIDAMWGHT